MDPHTKTRAERQPPARPKTGRRTKQQLLERTELLETIMDHVPVMIALVDPQGRTEYVNRHWQQVLGWSLGEARSLDILAKMYPDPEIREGILQLALTRHGEWRDYRTSTKDRRTIDTTWANVPLSDGSSISIGYDISERKRSEKALQESEVRFRALIENGWDGLTLMDRNNTILYSSPSNERIIGYGREEREGKDAAEFIHPDDLEMVLAQDRKVVEQPGAFSHLEYRAHDKAGAWKWIESIAHNLLDEPGVQAIVINFRDITERKQTEQALRNSELRFRALIENSWDGLTLVDRNGIVLYASPSNEPIFGYKREEREGRSGIEFIHPDDYEKITQQHLEIARQPGGVSHLEYRIRDKNGSVKWIEGIAHNLLDEPSVQAIVVNFRDITERKQAEEKIRRQLDHLTALSEIDRAITSSFELRLNLETLLGHATRQLGADAAGVLLFDAQARTLRYMAGKGFRTPAIENLSLNIDEGHAGRAASEGHVINVPDLSEQPDSFLRANLFAAESFASYSSIPLLAKGELKGVLEVFHRTPFSPDEEWLDFFKALAEQAAIAIDNATLFSSLQRSNQELSLAYDATIEGWSRALDLRDKETEGHTQRVTEMTIKLARTFGLSDEELVHVRRGSLLHDIGKMGVPDHILFKTGELTKKEWVLMKKHPAFAYEMLLPITYLHAALDIPYCHHEKWDGTGYPRGLKGEEIPLTARIFAVVDVWDALTSDRPYRAAWPQEKVTEHIRSLSGAYFDPRVVKVCLESGLLVRKSDRPL